MSALSSEWRWLFGSLRSNIGGAGNDTVTGFANLTGSGFDDVLTGSSVSNVITGLSGNDVLNGAAGTDNPDRGAGSDTFLFAAAGYGKDVVTDFEPATDTIHFTDAAVARLILLSLENTLHQA